MNTAASRRSFLRSAGAVALATAVSARFVAGDQTPATAPARRDRQPLDPTAFRRAIEGPIYSLPTPFTADFAIDFAGVAKSVDRAAKSGIRLFSLTGGNSEYDALSYEEIKSLTRAFVEAVGGRGLVIAAGGGWWTGQAVDYAKYAESIGADAVQVQIPTRRGGEDAVVRHFRAVAEATRLPIVLHGDFAAPLLRKLVEIPPVAAMKEDVTLDYYIARQIEFGERLAIFGGGGEHRFLVAQPYGSRAFYSVYAPFAPDVAMQYWRAFQSADLKQAAELARKYDHPLIQRFSKGFWHASMEYFGVAQRYLRPPQESFTDEQIRTDVKPFYDKQGLSPESYAT